MGEKVIGRVAYKQGYPQKLGRDFGAEIFRSLVFENYGGGEELPPSLSVKVATS
jgi:hypothetical protein